MSLLALPCAMPSRADPLRKIASFNKGRHPELLALKYRKMAASPFGYFRGTNHLFHADWPGHGWLERMPAVWLNGDLHLENFGTYRGDNRLVYFDVGDFDDGALGPLGRDLVRFMVGVHIAGYEMGFGARRAQALNRIFVAAYRAALIEGKARWIERRTARGVIGELLMKLDRRTQADLLAKRTVTRNGKRRLRTDTGKALALSPEERARVVAFMKRFAEGRAVPSFFKVLDVAQRVAGVGALGLKRYVVLMQGDGGRDGAALIDLKSQIGSTLAPRLKQRQPKFGSEAARVVAIENRMQAVGPAFLAAVRIAGRSFTLRELQPSADKLDLSITHPERAAFETVIAAMGELTAWAQLRCAGRDGATDIEGLMAFARNTGWSRPLVALAKDWASVIFEDWRSFRESKLAAWAEAQTGLARRT
ncbi:DUF2252 domain-containing protein [Dongia deserti]|uniref:DUF2252 domain-containing protein n=1 Tax=Dongia deserti TaxID=2268030 RepID=UPI000E655B84|nr:DUF2252 family protein [Dongia deserti]